MALTFKELTGVPKSGLWSLYRGQLTQACGYERGVFLRTRSVAIKVFRAEVRDHPGLEANGSHFMRRQSEK